MITHLNKSTNNYHFPLPFINQVLDGIVGKKLFSFFNGFSVYNQIQINPKDQDNTTFKWPWGTFSYRVLPFDFCNSHATFQRVVLSTFVELVQDTIDIYMDEFTPHGNNFQEALYNICKVLKKWTEFLMNARIFLGHFLFKEGV